MAASAAWPHGPRQRRPIPPEKARRQPSLRRLRDAAVATASMLASLFQREQAPLLVAGPAFREDRPGIRRCEDSGASRSTSTRSFCGSVASPWGRLLPACAVSVACQKFGPSFPVNGPSRAAMSAVLIDEFSTTSMFASARFLKYAATNRPLLPAESGLGRGHPHREVGHARQSLQLHLVAVRESRRHRVQQRRPALVHGRDRTRRRCHAPRGVRPR
jgi:hypothetical protein